ncbi:VanZ family protein [Kribbella catacumbae]|uniref:VanZ family protein n=1 Tax=Kribbella catacumbae TaxID=460086 RepID=UPI0003A46921|nr:VanZ family protein [Kribbella catacumbae]
MSEPVLRTSRTAWFWRAAFAAACLIHLYGVYAPRQAGSDVQFPYSDKFAHLLLFGAVAYLGLRSGVRARWLLPVVAANAVVSEVVQYYWLPFRSGDPLDSVADLCGVALGAWLGFRALRAQKLPSTT